MMGPVNQQPLTANLSHVPSPTNTHHHHPGSVNDLLIAGGTSSRLVASANACSSSHSPSMETPAVAASHLLLDQFYSSNGSNGGGAMAASTTAAMAAAAAAANSYYHYQHQHHSQNASSATATGNSNAAVELKPDVDVLSKLNSYSAASWMMQQQQQQAPHPSLYSAPPATNADSFPYASPFGCHYPLPSSASFNNYVMNGFSNGSHAGHGTNTACDTALYKPFLNPAVSIPNGGSGDHLSMAALAARNSLALNGSGGGNATAAATAAAINQSLFQQWSQANGVNGNGYCITSTPAAGSAIHLQHSQTHLSEIKPVGNAKLKGVLHGTPHLVTPLTSHPHSRMISRGPPAYPTGRGTNNVRVRTSDKYRTVYTEPQRFELEKEFRSNEFINSDRKSELSTYLQLTERQIKIWFQNSFSSPLMLPL